jgi:hypothetical protein
MGGDNKWLVGSLLSAYILARRAGLKVDLPREYSDWHTRPLLLLPSPLTSTERNLVHVHTSFWDEVRSYVETGGTVYASLCADAAIPEMSNLFGAALADHAPEEEVTLIFTAPFGGRAGRESLAPGETFCYRGDGTNPRHWAAVLDPAGGQVIAVDQAERPALVANTYGRGKTLLSAYPLESYLAVRPSAFEDQENTHAIYRALRAWAGVKPRFATDQPSVEIAVLAGEGRGYAVLANHRSERRTVTVTARDDIRSVLLLAASGPQPVVMEKRSWKIDLEGYGGAVVEWKAR